VFILADITTLSIKIDRNLKAKADSLFNDMGMTMTTAVNVFIRQAVQQQAIPFQIFCAVNAEAKAAAPIERKKANVEQRRAAMQEIRDMMDGVDGSSVDLAQMKAERRADRYEYPN